MLLFTMCGNMLSDDESKKKYMDNMVLIRADGNSFEMGSDNGGSDEKPVHTVKFTYDFYMDTTEVRQREYSSLMSSSYMGYTEPAWTIGGSAADDTYPAYWINWFDAVLYCNARSRDKGFDTVYSYSSISGTPGRGCELIGLSADLSKKGFRLPTEAEWEFACRAGSESRYYWGDSADARYANGGESSGWPEDSYENTVAPAGNYRPNSFGLYDMCGSLWEWCNDWYDPDYYSSNETTDPLGPDSIVNYKTLRGGAWNSSPDLIRSSNRLKYFPYTESNSYGFRCVCPD